MENGASLDLALLESLFISHLLALEDKSNLVNFDTFLLLQGLLHLQHGVAGVEGEILAGSGQSL